MSEYLYRNRNLVISLRNPSIDLIKTRHFIRFSPIIISDEKERNSGVPIDFDPIRSCINWLVRKRIDHAISQSANMSVNHARRLSDQSRLCDESSSDGDNPMTDRSPDKISFEQAEKALMESLIAPNCQTDVRNLAIGMLGILQAVEKLQKDNDKLYRQMKPILDFVEKEYVDWQLLDDD